MIGPRCAILTRSYRFYQLVNYQYLVETKNVMQAPFSSLSLSLSLSLAYIAKKRTTLPVTVARTRQHLRLQVRTTFVRLRYHQGLRWVRLRESLGPEDDAFRSNICRGSTLLPRIIRWSSKQPVFSVKAIGPRHLLGLLSDSDFGRRAATTNTVIIFITIANRPPPFSSSSNRAREREERSAQMRRSR